MMNEQGDEIIVIFQAEETFPSSPLVAGEGNAIVITSPERCWSCWEAEETTAMFAKHSPQHFRQQIYRLKILLKPPVFLIKSKNKLCKHTVSQDLY